MPNKYLYHGEEKTLAELSEISGLETYTLRNRLAHGFSVDAAVEVPKRTEKEYTYDGMTKTLREWSAYLNISEGTLRYRMNGLKWPIEKVLSTYNVGKDKQPEPEKPIRKIVPKKSFVSIEEIAKRAKQAGMSYGQYVAKVNGW